MNSAQENKNSLDTADYKCSVLRRLDDESDAGGKCV